MSKIKAFSSAPLHPAAAALIENLRKKFPGSAVVFYGSGNSVSASDDPASIVFDFYVIVEDYQSAYKKAWLRIANWLIPPNVFYLEVPSEFGVLRAKYAVLSAAHFEKLNSAKTFHSYFWARFAQPCRVVAENQIFKQRLESSVATAISVFMANAVGLMDKKNFTPHELWMRGLGASYRAELRAEDSSRAQKLMESYGAWAQTITRPALDLGGIETFETGGGTLSAPEAVDRFQTRLAWRLRAVFGAYLSVIRLLKGTQTFNGGIEYITWKIERHTGVHIPLSDWERSHPFLAAPRVAVRYFRLRSKAAS